MSSDYGPPEDYWDDSDIEQFDTQLNLNKYEIKKQPIQAMVERKRRFNRDEDYISKFHRVLCEFQAVIYQEFNDHICNIDDSHVIAFHEHLKGNRKRDRYYTINAKGNSSEAGVINTGKSTREHYLFLIANLYEWLVENQIVSQNPAIKAIKKLREDGEFDTGETGRPKKTIPEMRAFLEWLDTPLQRCFFLLLLKTGVRRSEVANIDLRDLNLDHPIYQTILENHDIELVSEVEDKSDSLYIMPSFDSGETIRGEKRPLANKRNRQDGTVIPVDQELKTALIEYLLARPLPDPELPCHPLFLRASAKHSDGTDRLTKSSIYETLLPLLGEYSPDGDAGAWYESGAPIENKIDLHYFRHYFTHNHKHQRGVHYGHMPDGVIAYIRGDKDSKSKYPERRKTYSHQNWDEWVHSVRDPYLNGIYTFGVYD